MNAFEFSSPRSVAEALELMDHEGAVAHAGGVDLLDRLKERLEAPSRLVALREVKELVGIKDDKANGLTLGALTRVAEIAESPLIRDRYPALAEAASHVGTPNVRNMATLGGNLAQRPRCWYFRNELFTCKKRGGATCFAREGENEHHAIFGNTRCAMVHPSTLATVLVALDASLALQSKSGTRKVKLEDFFTAPEKDVRKETVLLPGELITRLTLPAPAANTRSAYLKQGARESFDWPIADVAVMLTFAGKKVTGARVILGAAAAVPHRASAAEAALIGKEVEVGVAKAAGAASMQGAKPLAHNRHKVEIFKAVVARAALAAAGEPS